ncbi:MAG: hypothetical protein IKG93_06565 [Clostridiales bacterium]|nr:hypothetical protein [Clostridiales bacterium]
MSLKTTFPPASSTASCSFRKNVSRIASGITISVQCVPFKATSESAVSVKVSWNAVTGATGYQVWRSASADSGFVLSVP